MKPARRWAWVKLFPPSHHVGRADTSLAKRLPDIKMAQDIDYTSYPSYAPYKTYGPYASAVDEAGAKTDMAKRHEMMIDGSMMTEDNMKRDMPMMDTESTSASSRKYWTPTYTNDISSS